MFLEALSKEEVFVFCGQGGCIFPYCTTVLTEYMKGKKYKENATFLLWPKKCFLEGGELRASLVNLHCNFSGMLDGDSEGEITFQGAPLSHF